MPIGISKDKFWKNYKQPCLKYMSGLSDKTYSSYRQSINAKIYQLKKEYKDETNPIKKLAIRDVINALENLK